MIEPPTRSNRAGSRSWWRFLVVALAVAACSTANATGSTSEAGSCVIAVAERDGRTVIVAVLGASTNQARFDSATKLLDWAFAQP